MYLNLVELKEQKDGSAIATFDYDKEFVDTIKLIYKRKRATKALIKKAILDGLRKGIEDAEVSANRK